MEFHKNTRFDKAGTNQKIEDIAYGLNTDKDLDPLLERIGDARFVLLGEASHGTHEYYTWRTRISKRLIKEKGFSFIAVEGDWPDCYKVNRYIKNYMDAGKSIQQVLKDFNRWPTWMWANWEIVALGNWLHDYNSHLPLTNKIGFYGLDVYSLWESMEAIIKYLEKADPDALRKAKKAFYCFEPYREGEGQAYAIASSMIPLSCEREVIEMLSEIRRKAAQYNTDPETPFSTEQNALITVNAERYYRTMIRSGALSWNIRDQHMIETLNRLMHFHGKNAKAIVWEHNTHIGDARATDMADEGMINVGELVREQYSIEDVVLVGFGSYQGSVIAGKGWGEPMQKMIVPPAREGSWEAILHETNRDKLLILDQLKEDRNFMQPIDHRAIGVVYHPEREKFGNYVPSIMPSRYDAFVYIDETNALHPLHIKPDGHQMPETYPWGV